MSIMNYIIVIITDITTAIYNNIIIKKCKRADIIEKFIINKLIQ